MAKLRPMMIAPPAIFLAFVVMAGFGMMRDDPDALPSARKGQTAPPVVLTQLGDKPLFDDATLRTGGIKLVNIWASWCAPCRVEHPNLEKLSQEGVRIYGVNFKDDPAKALAFLEELGDPYVAVGADESGRTAIDWGAYGVPETFVIDGSGTILLRHAGPVTQRVVDDIIRPVLSAE